MVASHVLCTRSSANKLCRDICSSGSSCSAVWPGQTAHRLGNVQLTSRDIMTRFNFYTLVHFDLIHALQDSKPLSYRLYPYLLQGVRVQLCKNIARDSMLCVLQVSKPNTLFWHHTHRAVELRIGESRASTGIGGRHAHPNP